MLHIPALAMVMMWCGAGVRIVSYICSAYM